MKAYDGDLSGQNIETGNFNRYYRPYFSSTDKPVTRHATGRDKTQFVMKGLTFISKLQLSVKSSQALQNIV